MLEGNAVSRLFTEFGCNKIVLNGQTTFEKDGTYYRLTLLKSQKSYMIETAESIDEAKKTDSRMMILLK